MKKFFLTLSLSAMTLFASASDDGNPDSVKGIIATYEGSEVCYRLDDIPQVTYAEEDGVKFAFLTLNGQSTPVAKLALKDGAQLIVTYGEYVPSSVDASSMLNGNVAFGENVSSSTDASSVESNNVVIDTQNGRKIIKGGKLIILKDGKQYNSNGTLIK